MASTSSATNDSRSPINRSPVRTKSTCTSEWPAGSAIWSWPLEAGAAGWTHLGNAMPAVVPKFENVMMHALAQPALLAETPVESDGSFFLHVPSEQPLRMELRDRAGRVIEAERGWFWMRRGEQRVCGGCHAGPERAPENAVPKVLLRADVPVPMIGGGK